MRQSYTLRGYMLLIDHINQNGNISDIRVSEVTQVKDAGQLDTKK